MPVCNFVMHVHINLYTSYRETSHVHSYCSHQASETTMDDTVPYIAKLMLTYGVSYEFYHELSSVVKELPRLKKVYKHLLATLGNVTYTM